MQDMDMYTCAAGESFDSIALREYGDERYAGKLMEANGQYAHLLRMQGGETLVMPEFGIDTVSTLPPWKRGG